MRTYSFFAVLAVLVFGAIADDTQAVVIDGSNTAVAFDIFSEQNCDDSYDSKTLIYRDKGICQQFEQPTPAFSVQTIANGCTLSTFTDDECTEEPYVHAKDKDCDVAGGDDPMWKSYWVVCYTR